MIRLLKLPVKLIALPIIALLAAIVVLMRILVNLSAYVTSPLILIIFGLGIYNVVEAQWFNVAFLVAAELLILTAMFAAVAVSCILEDLNMNLITFLHS